MLYMYMSLQPIKDIHTCTHIPPPHTQRDTHTHTHIHTHMDKQQELKNKVAYQSSMPLAANDTISGFLAGGRLLNTATLPAVVV